MNCSSFKHRTKGLNVVNTRLLRVTLRNELSLKSIYLPISFPFNSINPFTTNDICSWRSRNKNPCVILKQGINFTLHRITPLSIWFGLSEGFWFYDKVIFSFGGKTSMSFLHGGRTKLHGVNSRRRGRGRRHSI